MCGKEYSGGKKKKKKKLFTESQTQNIKPYPKVKQKRVWCGKPYLERERIRLTYKDISGLKRYRTSQVSKKIVESNIHQTDVQVSQAIEYSNSVDFFLFSQKGI